MHELGFDHGHMSPEEQQAIDVDQLAAFIDSGYKEAELTRGPARLAASTSAPRRNRPVAPGAGRTARPFAPLARDWRLGEPAAQRS